MDRRSVARRARPHEPRIGDPWRAALAWIDDPWLTLSPARISSSWTRSSSPISCADGVKR